jgi:hypothetical protein
LRRNCVELTLWQSVRADDHFLYREPDEHKQRCQQHIELDGSRRDECCYYAGDIHLHTAERFYEREPNGDDYLYADCDQ